MGRGYSLRRFDWPADVTADCALLLDGKPTIQRSGPNEVRGTSNAWPSVAVQGSWSLKLYAKMQISTSGSGPFGGIKTENTDPFS
jgi:hypothetical protein